MHIPLLNKYSIILAMPYKGDVTLIVTDITTVIDKLTSKNDVFALPNINFIDNNVSINIKCNETQTSDHIDKHVTSFCNSVCVFWIFNELNVIVINGVFHAEDHVLNKIYS